MYWALAQLTHAATGTSSTAWFLTALLGLMLIACILIMLRVRHAIQRNELEREKQFRNIQVRQNELEATLSSMLDGVFAVDPHEKLISLNAAAARLLDVRPEQATGRDIDEVVESEILRKFIRESLGTEEPSKCDLVVGNGQTVGLQFQAQAAVLRDRSGQRIGSLIVLHDVTQLRRLEVMRRDFVANVSHEVKTPVTAIKAAAETLLDSGDSDPAATLQFLKVIIRQADRLQAILEDLLSLARIEQESEQRQLEVKPARLVGMLRNAVETCAARAAKRKVKTDVVCPDYLVIPVNASLIEQAMVNLIDNAIKYGPEGGEIVASARRLGEEVILSVKDNGPGIPSEHLPRIFERFYRTDRARSRELGGTGLGLAIVKHIAVAHGGRVSVESTVGQGSTFRIHLPTF
ncbi:PAS domain-containing protein [Planctomycetales bacterium ZRK34]|nr:PAS domain-containing protein [Planctomycetales bacterium ZRK34]